MKTRKSNRNKTDVAPILPPVVITDIGELEKICAEPVIVDLVVRGKPVRFTGRRLKPMEAREVQLLMTRALPPLKKIEDPKDPKAGELGYDLSSPDYQKNKREWETRGRALAIWMCFPCFQERAKQEASMPLPAAPTPDRPMPVLQGTKIPGNTEEIWKWMEARQLDDDVLEALFDSLTVAEVGAYMGFTSDNSSPKS